MAKSPAGARTAARKRLPSKGSATTKKAATVTVEAVIAFVERLRKSGELEEFLAASKGKAAVVLVPPRTVNFIKEHFGAVAGPKVTAEASRATVVRRVRGCDDFDCFG